MTTLTNNARTILRSRVRRHPDVDQHVPTGGVSGLSNGDLVQVALLMGLDVPTDTEQRIFEMAKQAGMTGREALAETDRRAFAAGKGGAGMAQIVDPTDVDSVNAAKDANDSDTDADAPNATQTDESVDTKAAATVKELQALMGEMRFNEYQERLHNLAVQAFTPPPPPKETVIYRNAPAAPVDPAKVKGHVPQVVGQKTLGDAGIKCPMTVKPESATLDAYDAPDAPATSDLYVWPGQTCNIAAALAAGQNVFLNGPAGTGKTSFAKQLAARYGRPFARVSCNDQTDAPTLVGMPALDNGKTIWEDGQLTSAIRKPGTVVLIDEPSAARPGAMMILQGVLDDDRAIHIPDTGEIVPVAPGVVFLMADNTAGYGDENGSYEGTRAMNKATLDRMALTVNVEYLPPEKEAATIHKATGLDKKSAMKVAKFAALTRTKADKGDLSHGIGIRRLIALGTQLAAGADAAEAFTLAIVNAAPYDDREPLRQMWTADVGAGVF